MNKRDKKRLAAKPSQIPYQPYWRDEYDHWEPVRRTPVVEKSPYRSDAEKIALIGTVLLGLLGLEMLAHWAMHTHWMVVQILGFVLWLGTTAYMFAVIYVLTKRLIRSRRGKA